MNASAKPTKSNRNHYGRKDREGAMSAASIRGFTPGWNQQAVGLPDDERSGGVVKTGVWGGRVATLWRVRAGGPVRSGGRKGG
ncbi:MAG TPA: hypothetical protein PLE77_15170 [Kiritimatiellia bacterium]|nr:hypothetical protein [Kiritimatiellia bacterium]